MKVGVYVDAYNLYYGMRGHCGRSTAGWRWLDVRALAASLCRWQNSSVDRVVYCTARVDQAESRSAYNDQDVYLKALRAHRSIDVLELGRYVARAKVAPLARRTKAGVQIITPTGTESWSDLPIQSITTNDGVAMLMATVRAREEKGSDVNVATHLLTDVFRGEVQGAIVISNDSDLALPLTIARTLVPVGTVNPGTNPLAGALRGLPGEGAGRHWWRALSANHYYRHQLPDPVGRWRKPAGW
jgi:hypothetical protein